MCRFLRDRGVDAHLLLFDNELEHFGPVCDTYDLEYMHYTHQLSWGRPVNFPLIESKEISRDLAPYDFLIACGWAPAFCHKGRRKVDVMVPYGDDVYDATKYRWKRFYHFPITNSQIKGLRQCKVSHMAPTFPMYEDSHDLVMPWVERWFQAPPMVYSTQYDPKHIESLSSRTHWGHVFEEIRKQNEFVAFSHSRHVLGMKEDNPNYKGTDKILKGWAEFRKLEPRLNAKLIVLQYGPDVAQSKKMASELGISDTLIWMPLMTRKDLMIGVANSDVVFGQFGPGRDFTCGVVLETLVMEKPLLCARDPKNEEVKAGKTFPVVSAKTEQEIASQLLRLAQDRETSQEEAKEGRRWYLEQVLEPSMHNYLSKIRQKSQS